MSTGFRGRVLSGEPLAGVFVKTPAYEMIEVLAMSGLDFACLDGEHAPFDRGRMDACLAMGRALGFPVLVRTPDAFPSSILQALDSGAVGVVVPHVFSPDKAAEVAKAARFGHGGRGYAGSTRWAGLGARPMPDVLAATEETVVLGQIEEPEAVDAIDAIAATPGLDGLFVGPADLAVCYGETDIKAPVVRDAIKKVSDAAKAHDKASVTFCPTGDWASDLRDLGVTMFFVASEHAFILAEARRTAAAVHGG